MKQKQIEVKSYKTVYEAVDGTEFENQEDCKRYDSSFAGVMRGKMKKFVIADGQEDIFFNCGGEPTVLVCVPKNIKELDIIRQFLLANNNTRDQIEYITDDCVGRVIIVTISEYEDNVAWVDTLDKLVERLTNGKFKVVKSDE